MTPRSRSGGEVLLDQLIVHGATLAFGVPGESYLPVLDAFHGRNDLRFVVARQEGGAAMMADAYGKLTGTPGICFVTRGPGATNASAGLHVAFQDSTPMLLFVGQVPSAFMERGAFQELDYRRLFGAMSKWVVQIEQAERIPELIARAWRMACSGRPGPVVVALPENVLSARVTVADAPRVHHADAAPSAGALHTVREMLARAERPIVVVGEGGWSAAASTALESFARKFDLPVCASFRCQDYLRNDSAHYAGAMGIGMDPNLTQRFNHSDLILTLGARLGEVATQNYELLQIPTPQQPMIQVEPGADELGKVHQPTLCIHATVDAALDAFNQIDCAVPPGRRAWREGMRSGYERWSQPPNSPAGLDLAAHVRWLSTRLPDDAVITNGAGNYTGWVHRFYNYRRYRSQLAPVCGAMGYGLPAAVAAKIAHPERVVVCFAGDGCFQMTVQELGTAVQERAAVKVIVVNNQSYGTIRMHQERRYAGRVSGTQLTNPDFAALARSYGAFGEIVADDREFQPAFERALAFDGPALLELRVDPSVITPGRTLAQI